MPTMADLGELISRLNPYTDSPVQGMPWLTAGGMDIYLFQSASDQSASGGGASSLAQIQVEVERNYPGKWTFKGQEYNINTAIRIPYRFPVYDKDKKLSYWVTDYLLVGYEGAGGGG